MMKTTSTCCTQKDATTDSHPAWLTPELISSGWNRRRVFTPNCPSLASRGWHFCVTGLPEATGHNNKVGIIMGEGTGRWWKHRTNPELYPIIIAAQMFKTSNTRTNMVKNKTGMGKEKWTSAVSQFTYHVLILSTVYYLLIYNPGKVH